MRSPVADCAQSVYWARAPTVLQDLSLTFSSVLAILNKRTQRVATTVSILVRTGDLVQVFYVILLLTALVIRLRWAAIYP